VASDLLKMDPDKPVVGISVVSMVTVVVMLVLLSAMV